MNINWRSETGRRWGLTLTQGNSQFLPLVHAVMVCRWDCKEEAIPQFIAGISYSLSKGERYARWGARAAPSPRHPFFPTYLPCPGSQPATLEKGLLPSLLHSIPFHFGSFEFGMPSSSSLPPPIAIAIALLFTHSAATTKSSDARGAGGQSGKSRGHRRLSRGGRFIIHGILIWNHP